MTIRFAENPAAAYYDDEAKKFLSEAARWETLAARSEIAARRKTCFRHGTRTETKGH